MGTPKTISLTRAEAACLDAIRAGAGMQSLIALQTKLTLKDAAGRSQNSPRPALSSVSNAIAGKPPGEASEPL
jgi:hypothetical protein